MKGTTLKGKTKNIVKIINAIISGNYISKIKLKTSFYII